MHTVIVNYLWLHKFNKLSPRWNCWWSWLFSLYIIQVQLLRLGQSLSWLRRLGYGNNHQYRWFSWRRRSSIPLHSLQRVTAATSNSTVGRMVSCSLWATIRKYRISEGTWLGCSGDGIAPCTNPLRPHNTTKKIHTEGMHKVFHLL